MMSGDRRDGILFIAGISQYSLIDHGNALNQVFPAARAKERVLCDRFVTQRWIHLGRSAIPLRERIGKIPSTFIEKRRKLVKVAGNYGVDLRTAALRFFAAQDVAAALVVGCRNEQQILADYTSMQTKIPAEFWTQLKRENLIEQNAPLPA